MAILQTLVGIDSHKLPRVLFQENLLISDKSSLVNFCPAARLAKRTFAFGSYRVFIHLEYGFDGDLVITTYTYCPIQLGDGYRCSPIAVIRFS